MLHCFMEKVQQCLTEAAVLGTYSIYIDDEGRGYTDEEELKYGLVFNSKTSLIEKGVENP